MSDEPENTNAPSTVKRALRALQEMQAKLASLEQAQREPIAIIGMGCRLPGARNLAAFWQMLREGRNGVTEVPADRWDVDAFFNPDPGARGKIASRWGGFLDDLDRFDAQFFGISPREAPHVDPRQRLMLEVSWEALEDAGIPPTSLAGTQTGVFVAALSNDYDFIISRDYTRLTSFTGTGTANSIVANRVSYFLDLRGPSIALDTACSGSLLTIDLACRSLRSGESSLALAGGVSVNLLPRGDIFFSQAGALSPDGRCQAFDSRANGIVRSEGAGVVVLKPLSRALADGDRIYALIRGGAVNHDGRSNGMMAPNGLAQEAMLREAYRLAGVAPASVQFVETHGTGTPLGDPIEVKALVNVLGEGRPADRSCVLGSVKTNLGHLESSAGVAGIIKTALALHHRQIPPNLHFEELNPLITPPDFPLTVQTELTRWPVEDESLIAGVSGFSFGGTNVHLVLEEAPRSLAVNSGEQPVGPLILPLSGRSPAALREVCGEYRRFLEATDTRLTDICYTAGARRSHHDYRLSVIGSSTSEIAQHLSVWLDRSSDSAATGSLVEGRGGREGAMRLVFVFSGQGSHSPGMGRELYECEGVFRDTLDSLEVLFGRHVKWSLTEELFAPSDRSRLNETDIGQPAVFAMQTALVALWRSWGVVPAAVVGQSLGEVAAACAAGALSLEDGVSVVFHRSRLMRATSGKGLTAVVGLPPEETGAELVTFNGSLCVAGSSSPTSSVVSGEPQAVRLLVERLGSKNVFCRVIDNVDVAFHSPQMDPLGVDLEASLTEMRPQLGAIPFYSTVSGSLLEGTQLGARYWARNLREPFRFSEVVGQLIGIGYDSFLEISPHSVLSGAISQALLHRGSDGAAIPTLVRGEGEEACLQQALGRLYVEGYDVDWSRQYQGSGRLTDVPGYVWQRERYWHDQIEGGRGRRVSVRSKAAGDHPFVAESLRSSLGSGQFFWETELSAENLGYLKDHRIQGAIVIPGAAYLEMALAAVAQVFPGATPTIEDAHFDRALILADDDVRTLQLVLNPTQPGEVSFKVFSTLESQTTAGEKEGAGWTEHAAMRVLVDQSESLRSVSLAELRSRIDEVLDADEHYREMQSRRFDFGPSFRAIRGIWRDGDEALSLIELPEPLTRGAGEYLIHPVIIDAGFQTIAATLSRAAGETFLPRSVKHLRVFARPGLRLLCHIRLAASQPGPETIIAEIDFIDEVGNIVAEIQSLTLKRLDAARIETDVREILYELKWRQQPVVEPLRPLPTGHYLILGDRGGVGAALASRLAESGGSAVVIHSDRRSELEQIVKQASGPRSGVEKQQPFVGVVHLWSLDSGSFEETGLAGLDLAQQLGPLSALAVIRGLSQLESRATKLWMVTRAAHSINEGPVAVLQRGVWGLGKALAVEHPEMCGGLIDVDQNVDDEEAAREILLELMSGDEEQEVAWRDGERYAPRLLRWEEGKTKNTPVECRSDSSYLVTGGLSGLGLEAARWLIGRGARRLIIVGRRGLPARPDWRGLSEGTEEWQRVEAVKELERLGASIEYWAANVGDEQEMRRRWESDEAEGRPSIRGIIHSAGVIEDALAMRMSEEAYTRVQEGKVKGAFVLAKLGRELDFFIGYSSVSGVLGQVGQANYGAANAYLDGLMEYRQQEGKAGLSIAWGPWAEVGMWARAGFAGGGVGITPAMGAEILSHAFKSSSAQIVVLSGVPRELRQTRLLEEVLTGAVQRDSAESSAGPVSSGMLLELLLAAPAERQAMLESALRESVGRVLRCDGEHLNLRKPLPNLGLDSIMAVELKNTVEARLGLTVSMVDLFTASMAQLIERLEEQLENDDRLSRVLAEIEELSLDEVSVMLAEKQVRKEVEEDGR